MFNLYLLIFIPLVILLGFMLFIVYKQKNPEIFEEPEELKDMTIGERIERSEELIKKSKELLEEN